MFSGVVFTMMKADRCTKNNTKPAKRQQIYMAAKASRLLGLRITPWYVVLFMLLSVFNTAAVWS